MFLDMTFITMWITTQYAVNQNFNTEKRLNKRNDMHIFCKWTQTGYLKEFWYTNEMITVEL